MKSIIVNSLNFLKRPIGIILLFAFVIRVYKLHYNSPFLDEAIYIVLGKKVIGGVWQEEAPFLWVGGMPLFFPPLVYAFSFAGIWGARFLNVVLGTGTVYLIYLFTRQLNLTSGRNTNEAAGIVAALFMAGLTIPRYLSRFAIYDMLSFSLFLAGLVWLKRALLIKKPKVMELENLFFMAAILLFLAFLAKYIVVITFPAIMGLAWWFSRNKGRDVTRKSIKYFSMALLWAVAGYGVWQFSSLKHFLIHQVQDPHTASDIIEQFLKYTGLIYILAVIGVWFLPRKNLLLAIALLILSLIVPLVHVMGKNYASIHQHSLLSLYFIIPLASVYFAYNLIKFRLIGIITLSLVFILAILISNTQLEALEKEWHNSYAVLRYLTENIKPDDKLLSVLDDVARLELTHLPNNNIVGPYSFSYNNLEDEPAYRQALTDGYFDLLELPAQENHGFSLMIKPMMPAIYQEVYRDTGYIVYEKIEVDSTQSAKLGK